MEPVKPQTFSVRHAAWGKESSALRHVRSAVFVMEQQVSEDEEWDDMDAECLHALALDDAGTPIGTGAWRRMAR